MWLFLAFFAAFAVKVPMFPFHTWLPDAHVEAPTAGSVILASILLKMGAYGFLRFSLPMLPDASRDFTPMMVVLSIIAIIYGAYMALAQVDLKKLIAYSSVSHMGFVTLGLFVLNQQGIEGAVMQMVNHGITTGALFLCVGMIYERTHSRLIADNVGLAAPMPQYATFLVIFALSSLGLPGTNSFVGEFLVLVGTFLWSKVATAFASLGIILAAAYLLWMVQRVVFGVPSPHHLPTLRDLNQRELATLVPLALLVFWIGLFPNPLVSRMHQSVTNTIDSMSRVKVAPTAHPSAGGTAATAGGQRSAADDSRHIAMSLYGADLFAILPELIVVVTACLVIALDPITPASRRDLLAWLSVGALALCLGLTGGQISVLNVRVSAFSDLVVIDAYASFWKLLLYGVTGLTILMSLPYLKAERIHLGEYYGFILLALSGMMVMVSGADLLTIYLGTELMSLSLYVMAGLNRSKPRSLEAAAKYFVLGAFSSGILLYGISLLYGVAGSTKLSIDRRRHWNSRGGRSPLADRHDSAGSRLWI